MEIHGLYDVPDTVLAEGAPPRAHPATVPALARLLRLAAGHDATVAVVGAGTSISGAEPWLDADLVVATGRLDALLSYDPGELVVKAQAGMPFARLRRILADHGQRLALDPEDERGTLGGLVASDASGPLRLRHGTVRDQLLGVTVVLADGRIAHAGGNVVKNVAGYDLGKLYTGSLGTLGILAELTFRTAPLPPAARWMSVPCDLTAGSAFAQAVDEAALEPAAAQWHGHTGPGPGELKLLFEGEPDAVEAVLRDAVRLLGPAARVHGAEPGTADAAPSGRTEPEVGVVSDGLFGTAAAGGHPAPVTADAAPSGRTAGEGPVRLRLTAPPSRLPALVHAVTAECAREGMPGWIEASVGVGVATLSLPPDAPPAGWRRALDRAREAARTHRGNVVVRTGPGTTVPDADLWGPPPQAVDLMRAVKNQFDPRRRLNRHRFLEGL
ncbi:FAD-binding oxidoreductase [Rhizohabitans arisaemae]|uniref:FAD-binding oxidoreductase n=1 Tax=Rhizohabitans arisaemae TaxID=2720610 RepID=UPI0024B23863|nr:FAD-binding oxidoreductase [Rhizohabitans arisaemae]